MKAHKQKEMTGRQNSSPHLWGVLLVVCATTCSWSKVWGQQDLNAPDAEARPALALTARSTGTAIQLRWAPNSASTWRRCNEAGYVVVRHTVMRRQVLLPWEERSVAVPVTPGPIFPWSAEGQWRPLMERDSFAAIAAQALLGEDFELQSAQESTGGLVNRATEEQNRFAFGMFAADHSYRTALAMGLAWEDRDAKPNETYLYRVYPAKQVTIPLDTLRLQEGQDVPIDLRSIIDTGFFSIGVNDKFPLPKVQEVAADFGNRMATISWNKELFRQFYVSYRVERSQDGQWWQVLNQRPLITIDQPGNPNDYMFMVDSLPMNNRPYFYRVSGRTIFDDYGPPSDPVQGMGIDPLPEFYPYIVSVLENEQKGLDIGWEFNPKDENKILGFKIFRSKTDQGLYQPISGEALLPPAQRSFTDVQPWPVNYYRIVAYDAWQREMASFSALAQLDDETPPAPPRHVRGAILKDGTTVITWDANTEPDLLGYRVYAANHPNEEFAQISFEPVRHNHFIDTVNLQTLTRELYVQVIALDYRHNSSEFSATGVLLRPDTIAPAPPAFHDLEASAEGIRLIWANSRSKDVLRHELWRRLKGTTAWQTVAALPAGPDAPLGHYTDTTCVVGADYEYQVVAIDNSDLRSASQTVEARRLDNFIRPAVSGLVAEADRRNKFVTLRWRHSAYEAVRLFEVYRAEGDGPLNRYRTYAPSRVLEQAPASSVRRGAAAKGYSYSAEDAGVRMNTSYTYAVRAIYHDGGMSPLSEHIHISY